MTRKQTGRKAAGASSRAPNSLILPVIALWISVVVVLVGLIYWGEGAKGLHPKQRKENRASTSSQGKNTAEPLKPEASKDVQGHKPSPSSPVQHRAANQESGGPGKQQPEKQQPDRLPDKHPVPSAPERPPSPVEAPKPELADQHGPDVGPSSALTALASLPGKPPPLPMPPVPTPKVARVAIVIDDFGRDMSIARRFLGVPVPLTFSVLPFLAHTKEISELAHSKGHEVILHVPMEPRGYPKVKPGSGALLLSMTPEGIKKALQADLDANPNVSGINNHMGSRFTENEAAMRIVLEELQRRGLFFLDSFTSPNSVGYSLAKRLQVPSLRRHIFLDDILTQDSIRAQIDQLIRKAKFSGIAVAIGHPHEVTLSVLSEAAGWFEEEGIAVVKVGELMESEPSPQRRGERREERIH